MHDFYFFVIVASSILLSAITSARIAYVMAKRWNLSGEPAVFSIIGSVVVAVAICGVISFAAVAIGGLLIGLFAVLLTVPFVGFVWVFVVGANKAIERILNSLLKKVS
jgi:hypothetical protein